MRADARRNYDRLLASAHEVIAEHGADASLDDIARRAGVGSGTLYRHFPTREALLDAVFRDRVQQLRDTSDELMTSPAPTTALAAWVDEMTAWIALYRGLGQQLIACVDQTGASSPMYGSCEAMHAGLEGLLQRAQTAGEVRTDVNADDLGRMVNGVIQATESAPGGQEQARRLVAVLIDGLRLP